MIHSPFFLGFIVRAYCPAKGILRQQKVTTQKVLTPLAGPVK